MIKNKRRYWLAGNRAPEQDVFFVEALDPSLWRKGDEENWDACWHTGMPAPHVFEKLNKTKTINHIPGNNGLTVKSYLFRTLAAAADRVTGTPEAERMAFFPRVYAMPDDHFELQRDAARSPEKRWILKPKNSSRGRGVRPLRDVATAPMNNRWLVQEYVARPHLMNARKYVLRLYVLITSVEPLRIYFYREGFAKLASEPYDPDDFDNLFSNLTNPDINAANEDVTTPVEFVSLERYREWLRSEGHDDDALFARIRDLLILTMIAGRDKMRKRLHAVGADTSGCYELLGVDCLIDADLKPWILECNLSPSLEVCAAPEHGGDEEHRIKRRLVADMASLLGLNESPPVLEGLSNEDRIRRASESEMARAGAFERLFPAADVEDYLLFFPVPRYADIVQAEQVTGRKAPALHLEPAGTTEIISDDALALYSEKTATLYTPNPSASWIWLKAVGGADPEQIATELIAAHEAGGNPVSAAAWRIREEMWDVLADWAELGLVRRSAERESFAEPSVVGDQPGWVGSDRIRVCDSVTEFAYGCPAAAERMRSAFVPAAIDGEADRRIAIHQDRVGYAVSVGPRLIGAHLALANVAPVVRRILFEQAATAESHIAMQGAIIPLDDDEAIFIVGAQTGGWDGLALCLATVIDAYAWGGARLDLSVEGRVRPIGLPLRIDEGDAEEIGASLGRAVTSHAHLWPGNDRPGRLLASAKIPSHTGYRIRVVAFPIRGSDRNTRIRPTTTHEALHILIPQCAGPQTRLTCAAASGLADWLDQRALRTVEFSSFSSAAQALADTVVRENV